MNATCIARQSETHPGTEVAPVATPTECVSRHDNNAASRAVYQAPEVAPEVLLDMHLNPVDCEAEQQPNPSSCRRWAGRVKAVLARD